MTSAQRKWLLLALPLVLAAAVAGWWFTIGKPVEFKGMALVEPRPAPDFVLPDANGNEFRLSDQEGKVVLLFFGYTHCPDACPMTMRVYEQLAGKLAADRDKARLVFVTVDPERDTPERVAEYMRRFGNHATGLVGTPEQLEAVWEAYGIRTERVDLPDSALEYALAHSTQVFAIDPQGKVRLLYALGATAEDMEHDIRLLLRGI